MNSTHSTAAQGFKLALAMPFGQLGVTADEHTINGDLG
jgi:hypothetical protein